MLRGLSYIVLLVANMFYGKRTQSEIGPGNRGVERGPQEARCKLRGSPPSEVTRDAPDPPIEGLRNVSQGSVAKPECAGSLSEAGHTGASCTACTQTPEGGGC